ncbi:MAG: hypothetical protein KF746_17360 [Chitinophagaceae bacterium]|nr:hypothetical protein [Chitinophagaceae bacterium]
MPFNYKPWKIAAKLTFFRPQQELAIQKLTLLVQVQEQAKEIVALKKKLSVYKSKKSSSNSHLPPFFRRRVFCHLPGCSLGVQGCAIAARLAA